MNLKVYGQALLIQQDFPFLKKSDNPKVKSLKAQ